MLNETLSMGVCLPYLLLLCCLAVLRAVLCCVCPLTPAGVMTAGAGPHLVTPAQQTAGAHHHLQTAAAAHADAAPASDATTVVVKQQAGMSSWLEVAGGLSNVVFI